MARSFHNLARSSRSKRIWLFCQSDKVHTRVFSQSLEARTRTLNLNADASSSTALQVRLPTRSFLLVEIALTVAARLWTRLRTENARALALPRGWRYSMS